MQAAHFLGGVRSLRRGWSLVWTKGIRRYAFVPLLINILVFATVGWRLFESYEGWLESLSWLDRFGDWALVAFISTVLKWIGGIILAVVMGLLLTVLASFLASPFNGLLAERVEAHLDDSKTPASFQLPQFLATIPKALFSELRKLLYLVLWMIPIVLLHFIPGINIIAPFILFGFMAWMYAIEYLDYPLGNQGAGFSEVRKTLGAHRGKALGFGTPLSILVAIPVVNLIVIPIAVAGATALYVEQIKQDNADFAR